MSSTVGSRFNSALLVITTITGLVAAIGIVVQISRPQEVNIVAFPAPEALAARRDSLEHEAIQLQESLLILNQRHAELNEAIRALSDSLQDQPIGSAELDSWLTTVLKTVVVYLVLAVSAVLTPFSMAADVIGLLFGLAFPLTKGLWAWSWDTVTINWYWQRATPLGIILGMALVFGGNGESTRRTKQAQRRGRRARYGT